MTNQQKEHIAWVVIEVLQRRFGNFPDIQSTNRNAPFHEAFLRAFKDKLRLEANTSYLISLASWLHGLNTTLGQTFFEKVAHILSNGQKRSFTGKQSSRLKIDKEQKEQIAEIITNLKNAKGKPDLENENALLRQNCQGRLIEANDFTVDVFIETRTEIICIEMKSVRPNAGEMRGEKQKILEAKAALTCAYPGKKISFYMGFPFDPTADTSAGYDKKRFMNYLVDGTKYFDPDEILIAGELWDFLSGEQGTMKEIIDIINDIATPEFQSNFNSLRNYKVDRDKRLKIALRWHLFSEVEIIRNEDKILKIIQESKNKKRETVFYQQNFSDEGKYNQSRYRTLISLIA